MTEPHPPTPTSRAVVTELSLVPPNATLVLAGELDLHSAGQLKAVLDAVEVAGVERLTIDLSAVEFASLSALGTLVDTARTLGAHDGRVVVTDARPLHRRVLDLLGAPEALVVVPGGAG